MSTFRFDLNEEYSKRLEKMAEEAKMNIQDFIRYKLFGEKTIFTVEEAIRRIQTGDFDGKEFTLPDVFGEEWTLEKGPSGTLGRNFYRYITAHPELGIRHFPGRQINRRTVYIYHKTEVKITF